MIYLLVFLNHLRICIMETRRYFLFGSSYIIACIFSITYIFNLAVYYNSFVEFRPFLNNITFIMFICLSMIKQAFPCITPLLTLRKRAAPESRTFLPWLTENVVAIALVWSTQVYTCKCIIIAIQSPGNMLVLSYCKALVLKTQHCG